MCEGRECAAYTRPRAMLEATEPKGPAASSVELLSVSGLAPVEASKLAPVAGMAMVSWLACKSGTLDNDRALWRSLDMSIPRERMNLKPGAVTTSELLLVEKALVRGLCVPFVVLGLAPMMFFLMLMGMTICFTYSRIRHSTCHDFFAKKSPDFMDIVFVLFISRTLHYRTLFLPRLLIFVLTLQ